jgi:hypothetical protein
MRYEGHIFESEKPETLRVNNNNNNNNNNNYYYYYGSTSLCWALAACSVS